MNRPSWRPPVSVVIGILVAVAIGLLLRANYNPEWSQPDPTHPGVFRPWPVEADCYSQLARCERILQGQGLIQNHFTVENWPDGLIPSTTAPFDYVILLLYFPLKLFTDYPLDWAGALVSPALWLALVGFWTFAHLRVFNNAGRILLVIGTAVLPAIVWATVVGRPRHQSLILALIALALTAEYERWRPEAKRGWHITAGIAWGLACWTSLFEPLSIIVVLIGVNLILRRRENLAFLASFGAMILAMLVIERVHIFNVFSLSQENFISLLRWLRSIAEVHSLTYGDLMTQYLYFFFGPIFLFTSWRLLSRHDPDRRTDLFLITVTLVLAAIATVQQRWLCYAFLGNFSSSSVIARPIRAVGPASLSFRSSASASSTTPISSSPRATARSSTSLRPSWPPSPPPSTNPAASWPPGGSPPASSISPASRSSAAAPTVASKASLTVPSSSTRSPGSKPRPSCANGKVRWVVVYDDKTIYHDKFQNVDYTRPHVVLDNSRSILGLAPLGPDDDALAELTVAQVLIDARFVPRYLKLRGVTQSLKLYEYVPTQFAPAKAGP